MTWKCPSCGVEDLDDVLTSHPVEAGGCGYVKFPSGVALISDATSKEIQVRLPATFGSAALKRLDDPEVRFVSSEQFKIEKRLDQGGWAIVSLSWATNPLFLNGGPIPSEGVILRDGDKLSIKDKFFRLTIRLLG